MLTPEAQRAVEAGALFVINHSGGKDSQAMTIKLRAVIPADQLVIIHADLPEVDWEGIQEHIEATAPGVPFHICRSSTKTFLSMVEARGMFPSPDNRQCTSDLKRDPIAVVIRRLSKITGRKLIVSCMGMRAEESPKRRKMRTWKPLAKLTAAGREVYEWLPIHSLTTDEVFATIREAGQTPHWAYAAGMSRLSCCFCIMSNKADLRTAARLKPDLFQRYVELERRLDVTMLMPVDGKRRFLDEIVG